MMLSNVFRFPIRCLIQSVHLLEAMIREGIRRVMVGRLEDEDKWSEVRVKGECVNILLVSSMLF